MRTCANRGRWSYIVVSFLCRRASIVSLLRCRIRLKNSVHWAAFLIMLMTFTTGWLPMRHTIHSFGDSSLAPSMTNRCFTSARSSIKRSCGPCGVQRIQLVVNCINFACFFSNLGQFAPELGCLLLGLALFKIGGCLYAICLASTCLRSTIFGHWNHVHSWTTSILVIGIHVSSIGRFGIFTIKWVWALFE